MTNLLPRRKTSAIRCTKCEGYGHKVYQCTNWYASPMTHEDLKDYNICLKEVEKSVVQKLEVLNKMRREQKAQREQERVGNEEITLTQKEKEKEREARVQRILQRLEMLEKAGQEEELKRGQKMKELRERKEKEQQLKKERIKRQTKE